MALLNSQNFNAQREQFYKVNAGCAHHQPNISTVEWLILCSISRCGRSSNSFFYSSCWCLHSKQSFFSIFFCGLLNFVQENSYFFGNWICWLIFHISWCNRHLLRSTRFNWCDYKYLDDALICKAIKTLLLPN